VPSGARRTSSRFQPSINLVSCSYRAAAIGENTHILRKFLTGFFPPFYYYLKTATQILQGINNGETDYVTNQHCHDFAAFQINISSRVLQRRVLVAERVAEKTVTRANRMLAHWLKRAKLARLFLLFEQTQLRACFLALTQLMIFT